MMKRKLIDNGSNQMGEQKRTKHRSGYFGDPRLIPRVRKFLEAHKSKNVNVKTMAEDLQKQYGEYGRKKRNAFFKSVEKAYHTIKQDEGDDISKLENKYLSKKRTSSSSESDSDVIEDDSEGSFSDRNDYVDYQDTNSMNNMMSAMYRKTPLMASSSFQHSQTPGQFLQGNQEQYNNPGTSGTDACITIDDSSDSDTEMQLPDSSLPFFVDRRADKLQVANLLNSSDRPAPSAQVLQHPVHPMHTQGNISRNKQSVHSKSVQENLKEIPKISQKNQIKKSSNVQTTDNQSQPQQPSKKTPKKTNGKKLEEEEKTKAKKKKFDVEVQTSSVTFADFGGNDLALMEICKLLVHMKHPEVYTQLGITPPRGFLLHGPPGCGKTLLANAIAGELNLPFIKIAATEVVSGVSGESEEKIRDLFDKAMSSAPCVLFIDEIDAITPKRETASKDMERRIVAQLLSCMDDLNKQSDSQVLVVGATNRPDSLDPALRRAGRFDREICLGIPDEKSRSRILQVLCRTLTLNADVNFATIAKITPGYVGADLTSLTREAAMTAVNRVFNDLQCLKVLDNRKQDDTIQQSDTVVAPDKVNKSEHSDQGHTKDDVIEVAMTDPTKSTDDKELNIVTKDKKSDQSEAAEKPDTVEDESEVQKKAAERTDAGSENISVEKTRTDNSEEVACSSLENNITTTSDKDKTKKEKSSEHKLQKEKLSEHKEGNKQLHLLLSWLKEQPPLSEAQLMGLNICMADFEEAIKFVQPSAKREGFATIPDVTWEDVGALHKVREDLQLAILAPVRHAVEFKRLGITRAQGILLSGPPGCGKTMLAKAVANESGINFISVKGPELLNMYVGESERAVRQVFQRARNSAPCVIFFDELDALCPKRTDAGESGSSVRVVNQLLTEMDGLEERKQVFIMGATNRPDIIDPAILRPGRLDKILFVGLPTADDREDILKTITKKGTKPLLAEDVNLSEIANDIRCQCYTGADLAALVREASVCALKSVMYGRESTQALEVKRSHFEEAFSKVKPSVSEKDRDRYAKMQGKTSL